MRAPRLGEPAPEPEPDPEPAAAENPSWEAREERAARAGLAALQKVDGLRLRVPPTPRLGGTLRENRCYVVLATGVGDDRRRGLWTGAWRDLAPAVTAHGRPRAGAVFHGFASQREARCYWRAAFGAAPLPRFPAAP